MVQKLRCNLVLRVENYVIWYEKWYESTAKFYFTLLCPYKLMCVFAFEECIWTLHKKYLKYLTMHFRIYVCTTLYIFLYCLKIWTDEQPWLWIVLFRGFHKKMLQFLNYILHAYCYNNNRLVIKYLYTCKSHIQMSTYDVYVINWIIWIAYHC